MKKNLFYLLALFCALNLFSSCGDDDEKKDDPQPQPEDTTWKAVAGTYSADKLKLAFNGQEQSSQSVTVEATSAEKATVTLKGLIPAVDEVKVDLLMSKVTKAEEVVANYNLEGTATVEGARTVSVKGNVNAGVLTLNVDIKVDSPLVGTWTFPPYVPTDTDGDGVINESDYNIMGGSFFMSLTTDNEISFGGQTVSDYQFCAYADQKAEAAIAAAAPELTFLENGNITISYTKDGQTNKLEGLMGYYMKDNMLYVTLDVTALMGMLSKADANPLEELMAMAKNGIPLIYTVEDGDASILINSTLSNALLPSLTPILALIPTLMPNASPEMLAMLKEIGDLLPLIVADPDFQVGINLAKK